MLFSSIFVLLLFLVFRSIFYIRVDSIGMLAIKCTCQRYVYISRNDYDSLHNITLIILCC